MSRKTLPFALLLITLSLLIFFLLRPWEKPDTQSQPQPQPQPHPLGETASLSEGHKDPSGVGPSIESTLTREELRTAIVLAKDEKRVDELIKYLDPRYPPLAQDLALEALTELKAREALPAIRKLAASEEAEVLAQLMKSLIALANATPEDQALAVATVEEIYQRFTEKRPEATSPEAKAEADLQRSNAIETLGRIPSEISESFLLRQLEELEQEPYMQYFVVSALGELKARAALPALRELKESLQPIPEPRSEEELTREALEKAIEKAEQRILSSSKP